MRVRKAVIPAAGYGTRFLPATKAQPKEMLPVVDKPIIQYVVEEAAQAGIEDILIITGRGKRAIEDHFDRTLELEYHLQQQQKDDLLDRVREIADLVDIHFIRQKQPLGLGHAILQAWRHVGDEPFAILLGDEIFTGAEPCLVELIRQHERHGGSVVAVREVPREQVSRYGIVRAEPMGGRLHRVLDLVEKPDPAHAPSTMAVVGRYIVDPGIFPILADLPPGHSGEIQLTDGLRTLLRRSPVFAYEVESERYDVGEKLGYLRATVEFALAREDIGPAFREYLRSLNLEPAREPDGPGR
ncbi:UTP--glucose-1-phosphate uridylyltransferase GalU [Caldinitratiruptor microaerophilus]|uniref:UTP--glucose-1-phosphate uridylyltransferase n=1 Tax=Caldinitratiruptor microaerophilus TaxID=671077 RepID=A0AA35CPE2_9FIRM|nr:UTP--glucose-1-phosphate uridylyltransferase [Caldinitratiruptor microaerophilus]